MQTVPCNVCGEKREFDDVHKDPPANLKVVRCRGCGLVFVNPTFTSREHYEYYNSVYWNDIPTDASGSYVDFPPERVDRWKRRAKAHVDYLATFCKAVQSADPHVLDIGCGYGAHLEEIQSRCPAATLVAVEPNRRLHTPVRQRLPKAQILGKTLETLSGVRRLFDCILAVDLLDRTIDPTYTCRRIHAMLADHGFALIITRNVASRHGSVYQLPHLYYFSEGTLHSLLANCRFESVRLDTRTEYGLAGDEYLYLVVKKK